jgi:hypothetical protein
MKVDILFYPRMFSPQKSVISLHHKKIKKGKLPPHRPILYLSLSKVRMETQLQFEHLLYNF